MMKIEEKIIHIMLHRERKHTAPLVNLLNKEREYLANIFFFIGSPKKIPEIINQKNVRYLYDIEHYKNLLKALSQAKKVILHGAWIEFVIKFINRNPTLHEKLIWIPWGGDYYYPHLQPTWKKDFFKNVKYLMTPSLPCVHYIRTNYNAEPVIFQHLTYPVAIHEKDNYRPDQVKTDNNNTDMLNVLVGNSATQTNNHIAAFSKLKDSGLDNIQVYCPLSYGSKSYASDIKRVGRYYFGQSFHPLEVFLSKQQYENFLKKIHVGVFAHKRQQAMGNCYMLLGFGKTIYLPSDSANKKHLSNFGFRVKNVDRFYDGLLSRGDIEHNLTIRNRYFSKEVFISGWDQVFEENLG